MTISASDLETLTSYILNLETQVQFLMKERLLRQEGPAALMGQVANAPVGSRPRVNAGQPFLTTQELYDVLAEITPPTLVRKAQKPD